MTTDLLNVAEARAYLGGIARSTLYVEMKAGKLRWVKVRGSTFFRRAELDRYLRANERGRAA